MNTSSRTGTQSANQAYLRFSLTWYSPADTSECEVITKLCITVCSIVLSNNSSAASSSSLCSSFTSSFAHRCFQRQNVYLLISIFANQVDNCRSALHLQQRQRELFLREAGFPCYLGLLCSGQYSSQLTLPQQRKQGGRHLKYEPRYTYS